MQTIPIYSISYKNPERKKRMIDRFSSVGYTVQFPKEVEKNDPRIPDESDDRRTWSIMLQHLDAISEFYNNTNTTHCIVCEDDIHISKTFASDIQSILKDFDELKLDILMLGYLLPFKIDQSDMHKHYFPEIKQGYHSYPNDIWGAQMYLISRSYAEYLLNTFTIEFACTKKLPYNPDWIITKHGNRALLNPMIAVEEGINLSENQGQIDFHKRCHLTHYDADRFI
jgi:hypothetical protein